MVCCFEVVQKYQENSFLNPCMLRVWRPMIGVRGNTDGIPHDWSIRRGRRGDMARSAGRRLPVGVLQIA